MQAVVGLGWGDYYPHKIDNHVKELARLARQTFEVLRFRGPGTANSCYNEPRCNGNRTCNDITFGPQIFLVWINDIPTRTIIVSIPGPKAGIISGYRDIIHPYTYSYKDYPVS